MAGGGHEIVIIFAVRRVSISICTRDDWLDSDIVDDNRDLVDSLAMLVRLWGYECRAAYDGAAGLQAACDYQPDCLLLDVAMPGLDGYMLAREVRAQPGLDRAKLIALTAYSDETHAHLSQEAGFNYHFVKPPDIPKIKRLMDIRGPGACSDWRGVHSVAQSISSSRSKSSTYYMGNLAAHGGQSQVGYGGSIMRTIAWLGLILCAGF